MIARFIGVWFLTSILSLNGQTQGQRTALLTAHPWKIQSIDYSNSPELGSFVKSENDKIEMLFAKIPSADESLKRAATTWNLMFEPNGNYERLVSRDFATAVVQKGKWVWKSVDEIQCFSDAYSPAEQGQILKVKKLTKTTLVLEQQAVVNGTIQGTFDSILVPGVKQ